MKFTKIVATIGPASESEDKIAELILAGVNVFRFNFKHNKPEWHASRINRVRQVADQLGHSVGVLIDLQGPELRIEMNADEIDLTSGEVIFLGQRAKQGSKGFWLSHDKATQYLAKGQTVYAEDGSFEFRVLSRVDNGLSAKLKVIKGGLLKRRKNCNIPGTDMPLPVLIDRDFEALKVASKNPVDYLALSFVRSANDIKLVRQAMAEYQVDAKVVAKIEARKAIDNIDEIITASDVLMVARGDLGVELPIEQVPYHQKVIIKKCIEKGVPVITATQMLQTMISQPVPTRAEVSDVANAIFDKTDAIMLSAETATGQYPVEAVKVMTKTAMFNDGQAITDTRRFYNFEILDREQLVCDGAYNFYITSYLNDRLMRFNGIVAFSETGRTVLNLAKYKPNIPILAFVPNKKIRDGLSLVRGVVAFDTEELGKRQNDVGKHDINRVKEFLTGRKLAEVGNNYILVHGDVWKQKGGTSTVRVIQI